MNRTSMWTTDKIMKRVARGTLDPDKAAKLIESRIEELQAQLTKVETSVTSAVTPEKLVEAVTRERLSCAQIAVRLAKSTSNEPARIVAEAIAHTIQTRSPRG